MKSKLGEPPNRQFLFLDFARKNYSHFRLFCRFFVNFLNSSVFKITYKFLTAESQFVHRGELCLKLPLKTKLKLPPDCTHEPKEAARLTHTFLIGTKKGTCDICKATKKIHLFRYGYNVCEDCLNICTTILEQLSFKGNNRSNKQA